MFKHLIILSLLALTLPIQANASERVEQLQRISDGLNSANPVIRLVTLEEALVLEDENLRDLAIQTALSSNDKVLKNISLKEILKNKSSLLVVLDDYEKFQPDGFAKKILGSQLEIYLSNFNTKNGQFNTHTPLSDYNTRNGKRVYALETGVYSGERISFKVNIQDAFVVGRSTGFCSGAAKFQEGTLKMKGTMNCANRHTYNISIDILN